MTRTLLIGALALSLTSVACHAGSETVSAAGILPDVVVDGAPIRVIAASRDAEARLPESAAWTPVEEDMRLPVGSLIATGNDAQLILQFKGPSYLLVKGRTLLQLAENRIDGGRARARTFLRLGTVRAKVKARVGHPVDFIVETPAGLVEVDGTAREITHHEEFGMSVEVAHGRATARAARDGRVGVGRDQRAEVVSREAKAPREVERDALIADLTPHGLSPQEQDAARRLDTPLLRPVTDAASATTLTEQASLASGDASLVFRYEVLVDP